jgi:Amt family ammonium transporter
VAERVRFGPFCLFVVLWTTLVYDPLAHWVWAVKWEPDAGGGPNPAGWLGVLGTLDFAGGAVVHAAAGMAGLAAVLVLRPRHGFPGHTVHPNSMVLTLFGVGVLWFGWFGFTAGSATAAGVRAVTAFAATQAAAAAAGLSWVLIEWAHRGKPTALGFASGVVGGLVAVTPASGYVAPGAGLAIGLLAGGVCYGAVLLKPKFGYDDSLDTFGIHGVGGLLGVVLTGALVSVPLWRLGTGAGEAAFPGVMKDGPAAQVWVQLVAAVAAATYSFLATAILVTVIDRTVGLTVTAGQEADGLDRTVHGEVGFDYSGAVLDEVPTGAALEPRPATAPPEAEDDARRFTLVVEGPGPDEVRWAWVKLCDPKGGPPTPEFRAVYRNLTTFGGNKFHFRGGNHVTMREYLQRLLEDALDGAGVRVHADV